MTDQGPTIAEKIAPGLPVPTDPATLPDQRSRAAAGSTWRPGLPRLSRAGAGGFARPTTYAGHPFWEEKDKAIRRANAQFFKNVSIMGGRREVDTAGKPGVAWRARRAAHDVRREARQLGSRHGRGRVASDLVPTGPRRLGTLRR